MPSYVLRSVDRDLWAAVKAKADSEGRNLRYVILSLLREYTHHGLRPVSAESFAPPTVQESR